MYTWQYNGIAPWSEVINWCYANVRNWESHYETITFYHEPDYVWFLLKWA